MSRNIIGVPLDDMLDEFNAYKAEGISRQDAIEYTAYRRGASQEEYDARCRTIKAILSTKQQQDLGHLLDM